MAAPEHFDSADLHEQRVRLHDPFAYRYRVPVDGPSAPTREIQERLERSEEDFDVVVDGMQKEMSACCRDELEREVWRHMLEQGRPASEALSLATGHLRAWMDDMDSMLHQQIADARAKHIVRNWWIRRHGEPRSDAVEAR